MRSLAMGVAIILGASVAPSLVFAQSQAPANYASCDGKAYLTQGYLSRTYALDLNTSDYQVVAEYHPNYVAPPNAWTEKAALDGLGYNANDGFVYGWSRLHKKPVKLRQDWSVEPLAVDDYYGDRFYAGDVSAQENRLYLYSSDSEHGLYYVDLREASQTYLRMLPVSQSKIQIDVEDIAVHPVNGNLYGLESGGNVIQVDPNSGAKTILGNAGVYGSFGAAFFDSAGNLYAGRNYDGKIFKIDIDGGNYAAELAAHGPAGTANEGFRCAAAAVTASNEPLKDFGDAPNSYGTTLEADGARHLVSDQNTLYLGSTLDGESDAFVYPSSDSDQGADEDGAVFVTNLVERATGRAAIQASAPGYLNIWLDSNRNGEFDADEHVLTDQLVSAGSNIVFFQVPDNVSPGDTWSRFRLSSEQGLQATGLANDGEVEDHPAHVKAEPVSVVTYPMQSGWSTIAFEDNWPFVGDYDMNDLVTRMRTRVFRNSIGITQIEIDGYITAAGAFYDNGFGIRLPGVPRDAIDEQNLQFSIGELTLDESPLEANRQEAIFIVTDNVFNYVTPGVSCEYYRTEPNCQADLEFSYSLSIPFSQPQDVQLSGVFDPFLFATPNAYHGSHFVRPPGRSYEIHLKNQAPTEAFDTTLFASVGQDVSNPSTGDYYHTESGMPWALEVGTQWRYPYELTELSAAYPDFPAFATSGGAVNKDWFLETNAVPDLIFPE